MPLSELVDNPADLLRNWPTKPQRFHRNPDALARLLTLAEVDSLIDSGCLAARNVVLLKDGHVLERYEYADDGADMPRRGVIRNHLNDGGSISLRALETLKPLLSALQRSVIAETGCRAHVNAYLTPPGNQGLKYHYDPYVTLVVQLHGHKTWPLHPPFVQNPVEEFDNYRIRGWLDSERAYLAKTPPAESITLGPGDVLWLPRGWAHAPHNDGDEPSLHLTFALKERTLHWAAEQVARVILNHALADPAFRAEIAPADLLGSPQAPLTTARQYLISALMHLDENEMAATLRRTALAG
jgi:hypothetical protein